MTYNNETFTACVTEVKGPKRDALNAAHAARFLSFLEYQQKTSRTIPVLDVKAGTLFVRLTHTNSPRMLRIDDNVGTERRWGVGGVIDPELTTIESAAASFDHARRSPVTVLVGLARACRPKQWTKNVLLFFGLIFALKLTNLVLDLRALEGFLVFCAASSGIYLLNDLSDVEKDRQHPKKRKRPIAAGVIRPAEAATLAAALLLAAFVVSFTLGPWFGALTVGYVALMALYTVQLKHVVLVDLFVLAAGFMIRAAAGAIVVGVPISPWLYVCTILASLFLALGKRRNELLLLSGDASQHRRILEEYSLPFLDQMIVIVTSATVMAYSLYTFSADNLPSDHSMMLTIPFVLYGIFRYMYLMHQRDGGGSPEEALLTDRPLLFCVVAWLATAVAVLYAARITIP